MNRGRPSTPVSELYGEPKPEKIEEYLDKTWSKNELAVLAKYSNKSVSEINRMLPQRSDLQIRRMLEFLTK